MWRNNAFIKMLGSELRIIQAPMAGSAFSDMVVAVSQAGGLGSARRNTVRATGKLPIHLQSLST
jgi:NAD(P)H-dependent flavin oxidoreductase YrpB (nitropropane dioxygenase family)